MANYDHFKKISQMRLNSNRKVKTPVLLHVSFPLTANDIVHVISEM